jgi:hypothetical protein
MKGIYYILSLETSGAVFADRGTVDAPFGLLATTDPDCGDSRGNVVT